MKWNETWKSFFIQFSNHYFLILLVILFFRSFVCESFDCAFHSVIHSFLKLLFARKYYFAMILFQNYLSLSLHPSVFVVCKQNDYGNLKLIISDIFLLLLLPPHLFRRRYGTFLKKITRTGAIYVVDELDFETKQNYDLIIRATDSVSGVYAEVPLSIAVSGNFIGKATRLPR